MTQLSIKVGRFMCDTAVEDKGPHALFVHRNGFVRNDDDDDDDEEDDDDDEEDGGNAMREFRFYRTSSSGDFSNFRRSSRNWSAPDFQNWNFIGAQREVPGSDGLEHLDDEDTGSGCLPWRDDYNRTICPHENSRILNLFRDAHLEDGTSRDGDEQRSEDAEVENIESTPIPLPWRSEEDPAVLDDASKYLIGGNSDELDQATPLIRADWMGSADAELIGVDVHPLASIPHSSSSSSFRNLVPFNAPPPSAPVRPDLSTCHSLSLSHWLSEAESRHSEPFCPQHHHVLNEWTSMTSAEPSLRSSGGFRKMDDDHHHRNRHRLDHHHHHQHRCHGGESSQSSSRSSSPFPIPDEEEEEECEEFGGGAGGGALSRHSHVIRWLMTNDLEETGSFSGDEDDNWMNSDLTKTT